MKKPGHKLIAIIPARNEEATVGTVVSMVRKMVGCDVLVVNDASIDNTAQIAKSKGAKVLTLALQLNAWGATQAGFRFALRAGYQTAVTLDSDGQHLAESIHSLLPSLMNNTADVVIGAYPQRGSRARKIAWSFFRFITGLSYEDLTSGLRAYNLKAMELLASPAATILDYQDLGVLLLLRKSGLEIKEIPVIMRQREAGKSKVFDNWFTVARYMIQTFILCLSKMDVPKPNGKPQQS
jgi:hypothetical protein